MLDILKSWVANIETQKYTFQNGTFYAIKSRDSFEIIRLLFVERKGILHFYKYPNVDTLERIENTLEHLKGEYHFESAAILTNWGNIQELYHEEFSRNDYEVIKVQNEKSKDFKSKMQFFSNTKRDYSFLTKTDINGNKTWVFWPKVVTINSKYLPNLFRYSSYAIYAGTIFFVAAVSRFSFPKINSILDSATIYFLLWLAYGFLILGIQIKYKITYAIVRGFFIIYKEDNKLAFYFVILLNFLLICFIGFIILVLASYRIALY